MIRLEGSHLVWRFHLIRRAPKYAVAKMRKALSKSRKSPA